MSLPTVQRVDAVVVSASSGVVVLERTDGARLVLEATVAQVARASALQHGPVRAIVTGGASPRIVALAAASEAAPAAMSADARTALFTQRWAHTLERLGR